MSLPQVTKVDKKIRDTVPAVNDKSYEKLEMELEELETKIAELENRMVNEEDLLELQRLQDVLTDLETKRDSLYSKLEEII